MSITRRLNKVRNSFYVYLPRSWCDRYGLTKASEVRIEQTAEGTLLIIPPAFEGHINRQLEFRADKSNYEQIESALTGAYIIGATSVKLVFPEPITIETREWLSQLIRRLPGFEILDEHADCILVSDTSEKQVILPILRRQFSTAKYMLNGLVTAMDRGDANLATRILSRDDDVDRHRYFVERLCHLALQDTAYARKISIAPSDCMIFGLAAKHVERIADHVCGAASQFAQLKQVSPAIVRTANTLTGIYEETMRIFFSERNGVRGILSGKDNDAFQVLEKAESIAEKFEKMGSKRTGSSQFVLLLLHLERVASYCADIGEIAINRIIGKQIGLGLGIGKST